MPPSALHWLMQASWNRSSAIAQSIRGPGSTSYFKTQKTWETTHQRWKLWSKQKFKVMLGSRETFTSSVGFRIAEEVSNAAAPMYVITPKTTTFAPKIGRVI